MGAAIALGFSALAQGNRQAAVLNKKTSIKAIHKIDAEAFPTAGTKRRMGPAPVSSVCNPAPFTSGPNAFGVGGGVTTYKQTCLTYNKDLNCYLWTHRRSADWANTNTMSSGSIQSTWLNVATGVWDSTILYYEPTASNPGRYPTGTFWNPPGNTSIAGTWVVGSGPDLVGNGSFTGTWYASRQLKNTSADQVNPGVDMNYQTGSGSALLGNTVFMNYDMSQSGWRCYVGGELNDTTTSGNASNIAVKGGVIGIYHGGSNTWSHDSIIPGYYFNRNGSGNGYATDGEGGRLCFGPDGLTGYWVAQGRLATNYNNSADSMLSPIVYKTVDGGATWAPILQGYDWSKGHPELLKNTGVLLGGGTKHFVTNYKHGVDVACDANGYLHLVCTMETPYKDGAEKDSLAFTYTYSHNYNTHRPIMWDLMTDGSCWKTMMIDSIVSSYVGDDPSTDSTAAFSPIANGTTFLPYGARLQVTRSFDGTKIIYSWADSDPSVTGTIFNSQPDIWMKALDLTTGKVTASTNVTNGIGMCFFHMASDIAHFDNTSNKWVAPVVYTVPRASVSAGVYDGTAPSDHYWVNCGQFGSADFTTAATVNMDMNNMSAWQCSSAIGVQTHSLESSVSNFPNPFNGTTNIVVKLEHASAINVNVYDAIGNLVFSKKVNGNVGENTIVVDGSSFASGVYHYTVSTGYEKVTKKMIVQK